MKDYLCTHFEKIRYIEKSSSSFHDLYPNINWLYNHVIKYNGHNKNFKIWRQYQLVGYDDNTVIIGYIKPQFNKLNFNEVLMTSIYDAYMISNVEKYSEKDGKEIISDNYTRFFGKKIVTCVFALDKQEPYYMSWYDEGVNLIEANSEMLRQNIYTFLKDNYGTENNSIYYFYNYWRKNCPPDQSKPSDFTGFLHDKYNEIKEKNEFGKKIFPSYINEFLNCIKFKIDACGDDRKAKKQVLSDYDNRDYFMAELDKNLDASVKRYLHIRDAEDDESDSDE
jgi:hypothetical protein